MPNIYQYSQVSVLDELPAIGTTIQPFCSMLSHSCVENTYKCNLKNSTVFISMGSIKKGSKVNILNLSIEIHLKLIFKFFYVFWNYNSL